jgi:arylsulfatase A-like enzyme
MVPNRLAAVAVVLALVLSPLSLAAPPNVVLIVADDLGWADLGCYGSKFHRTPHIDQLAADGVRFTDAYAAAPVCSPTRASILTGKYPARLHLTDWLPGRPNRPDQKLRRPAILQHLPLEEVTLAEILKKAGYRTALIGKWHLGGEGFEPQRRGFDVNIGGDETGTARSYFAPFKSPNGVFMPGLEKAPDGEYLPDRLTTEAEKFIAAHRDAPFFLCLTHYLVHTPLKAKPELVKKYKSDGKPGEQNNPHYAAMVESLDESVGRIRAKLHGLKLTDRTIILFFSDNGGLCTIEGPLTPATINAPLREGKGYLYEGGIREPLLVYAPGVTKAGQTYYDAVGSIDFFPTILDLCGLKNETAVDGLSFAPLLRGKTTPQREALYWHYPHYSDEGGRPGGAIRADAWKLIEYYESGRRELFNLKNDIGETQNVIDTNAELAKKLHAKLAAWRRAVGAQTMTPNSDYVPNPPSRDGIITLPARTAEIHGVQLRYEPLPHKDTLGFWQRSDDWASWEFTVSKLGRFRVEMQQGCGKGQGGSEVELSLADQALSATVEDTGNFQSFKVRDIGVVTLEKAGRYTLSVKAKRKQGSAVMDLRSVVLKPTR